MEMQSASKKRKNWLIIVLVLTAIILQPFIFLLSHLATITPYWTGIYGPSIDRLAFYLTIAIWEASVITLLFYVYQSFGKK